MRYKWKVGRTHYSVWFEETTYIIASEQQHVRLSMAGEIIEYSNNRRKGDLIVALDKHLEENVNLQNVFSLMAAREIARNSEERLQNLELQRLETMKLLETAQMNTYSVYSLRVETLLSTTVWENLLDSLEFSFRTRKEVLAVLKGMYSDEYKMFWLTKEGSVYAFLTTFPTVYSTAYPLLEDGCFNRQYVLVGLDYIQTHRFIPEVVCHGESEQCSILSQKDANNINGIKSRRKRKQ